MESVENPAISQSGGDPSIRRPLRYEVLRHLGWVTSKRVFFALGWLLEILPQEKEHPGVILIASCPNRSGENTWFTAQMSM